jgi:ubiquinone biosynthesis protein
MLFSRFRQLGRAVGQAQRFREIVGVFLKYGYDDLATQLPLTGLWRWLPSRRYRREHADLAALPRSERLRRAFEELGPAFVKLGQLLASRTRLLPRDYTDELAKLNDHVLPVPFAAIHAILDREFTESTAAVFAEIAPEPLGAASIAQVHAARLADGTAVVLKIQRPEIDRIIRVDLEIMAHIAELLEKNVEGWQVHQPTAIVAEFARRIELELDFSAEAAALERFARQFAGDPTVRVPGVVRIVSTRRVLTMERIDGIPAGHLEALAAAGLDCREIARRLADLTLRQVFVHGFLHGDPHAGNVHILPGNVVCFLDFGLTSFLTHGLRDTLAALLAAIAGRDERAATAALLNLAGAELEADRPGLEADVAEFIHRHFGGSATDAVFATLLQHLIVITGRHALTLPPEIFTVIKALGQVEHLVRSLDPELDLLARARPYVRELQMAHVRPRRLLRDLVQFGGEAVTTLRTLPLEIRRVAAQLRGGKSKVTFRVEGLSPLTSTLERVTNRLAFAVVLAALLVASSLIIHAGIAPKWHGIPVLGLVGYIGAGLMGTGLMVAMLRHGRM